MRRFKRLLGTKVNLKSRAPTVRDLFFPNYVRDFEVLYEKTYSLFFPLFQGCKFQLN